MQNQTIDYFGLSRAVNELGNYVGLFTKTLKPGIRFEITTENHKYGFIIIDEERAIATSDGYYITKPTMVRISGATLGGATIKSGWILFNRSLELILIESKRRIILSNVQKIEPL